MTPEQAPAVPISQDPDGVALLFAALSLDRPFVALSPDPGAWPSTLAQKELCVLAPPGAEGVAAAAHERGFAVCNLPDSRAEGALGEMRCPSITTFTSGSTGVPKAVCRPADGVFETAEAIAAACELRPGDGVLAALPLGGLHGTIHGVIMASVLGSEATLIGRVDHRTLLTEFATGRHSFWAGTPHMADVLTRCRLPGPAPRAPRVCRISGSRLSAETALGFAARFRVSLTNAYGSVEHGVLSQEVATPDAAADSSSVGRPLEGVHIVVGDRPATPLPQGQPGRIWAHTPWQSLGIGFAPNLVSQPEREGKWIATSDVGWIDGTGRLHLLGRSDDLFKTPGGHLISPVAIEESLARYPGVRAVAVVPVKDAVGTLVGAVVEGTGLHAGDLLLHAGGRLPGWARPQVLEIVDLLPRLPSSKVDRGACVRLLERRGRMEART